MAKLCQRPSEPVNGQGIVSYNYFKYRTWLGLDCMTCFPFTMKSRIKWCRQSITDPCSSYATKLVKKTPTFTYLSKSTDVILCSVGCYMYILYRYIYIHIHTDMYSAPLLLLQRILKGITWCHWKLHRFHHISDCSSFILPFSCFFSLFPVYAFFSLNFPTSFFSSVFVSSFQ